MDVSGCWSEAHIAGFMADSRIPLRLAVQDGSGFPLVMSLWFLPAEGAIWCATNAQAHVVRCLMADPRCGFEIAGDVPPYKGVRGRGRATLHPDRGGEMLRRLLDRYGIAADSRLATGLLAKVDQEVAIRIVPDRLSSWDFSRRMKDAFGTAPAAS